MIGGAGGGGLGCRVDKEGELVGSGQLCTSAGGNWGIVTGAMLLSP